MELEGTLPDKPGIGENNADMIDVFPSGAAIELFTTRLKAEECLDVHKVVAIIILDENEEFGLEYVKVLHSFTRLDRQMRTWNSA